MGVETSSLRQTARKQRRTAHRLPRQGPALCVCRKPSQRHTHTGTHAHLPQESAHFHRSSTPFAYHDGLLSMHLVHCMQPSWDSALLLQHLFCHKSPKSESFASLPTWPAECCEAESLLFNITTTPPGQNRDPDVPGDSGTTLHREQDVNEHENVQCS